MGKRSSSLRLQDNPHNSHPLPETQKRILAVDDDPIIIELYKHFLEAFGYQATIKMDSEDALKIFTRQPERFDLLITDYFMVRLNGDELSKRVLAIRPDLPIILATGYSDHFSEQDALSLGVKHYIKKPFDIKILHKTIRMSLGEDAGQD